MRTMLAMALLTPVAVRHAASAQERTTGTEAVRSPAIIVGDSIVYDGITNFLEEFSAAGMPSVLIDAQGGRSIDQSGMAPWGWVISGVERVNALRAAGADADVWVVELGANNLPRLDTCQCDQRAEARRLIDLMRTAIGPRPIVWVNTRYQTYDSTSRVFNDVLWSIARTDPTFRVVDWSTHSAGHAEWFADAVHTTHVGSHALARCLARTVVFVRAGGTTLPTPTGTGLQPANRLGHTGRDLPPCTVI
jgi:hypothetical protein